MLFVQLVPLLFLVLVFFRLLLAFCFTFLMALVCTHRVLRILLAALFFGLFLMPIRALLLFGLRPGRLFLQDLAPVLAMPRDHLVDGLVLSLKDGIVPGRLEEVRHLGQQLRAATAATRQCPCRG